MSQTDLLSQLIADRATEVKSVATRAMTEVSIEKNAFVDGEKVKNVQVVKSEQEEVKREQVLDDQPIHISVDMSATISLGNFNMGKVGVSIHMPVGKVITPEIQAKIDSTYEYARKHCEDRMQKEVAELMKLKGKL